jgi:hypothetical protein
VPDARNNLIGMPADSKDLDKHYFASPKASAGPTITSGSRVAQTRDTHWCFETICAAISA